jgi:hypothetical protein
MNTTGTFTAVRFKCISITLLSIIRMECVGFFLFLYANENTLSNDSDASVVISLQAEGLTFDSRYGAVFFLGTLVCLWRPPEHLSAHLPLLLRFRVHEEVHCGVAGAAPSSREV